MTLISFEALPIPDLLSVQFHPFFTGLSLDMDFSYFYGHCGLLSHTEQFVPASRHSFHSLIILLDFLVCSVVVQEDALSKACIQHTLLFLPSICYPIFVLSIVKLQMFWILSDSNI